MPFCLSPAPNYMETNLSSQKSVSIEPKENWAFVCSAYRISNHTKLIHCFCYIVVNICICKNSYTDDKIFSVKSISDLGTLITKAEHISKLTLFSVISLDKYTGYCNFHLHKNYYFFAALHISALCHLTMKWLSDLIINTSLEAGWCYQSGSEHCFHMSCLHFFFFSHISNVLILNAGQIIYSFEVHV